MPSRLKRQPIHPGEVLLEEFMKPMGVGSTVLPERSWFPLTGSAPSSTGADRSRRIRLEAWEVFRGRPRDVVESPVGLRLAGGPDQRLAPDRIAHPRL
jgi:hypothetical protein